MKDEFKSEVIFFQGFEYKTIQSPTTGRIWLDRNLGASEICGDGGFFKFDKAICPAIHPDGFKVPSRDELYAELPNHLKKDIEWLNIPLAGVCTPGGNVVGRGDYTGLWSSSESGSDAYSLRLSANYASAHQDTYDKAVGFNVRLIKKEK